MPMDFGLGLFDITLRKNEKLIIKMNADYCYPGKIPIDGTIYITNKRIVFRRSSVSKIQALAMDFYYEEINLKDVKSIKDTSGLLKFIYPQITIYTKHEKYNFRFFFSNYKKIIEIVKKLTRK